MKPIKWAADAYRGYLWPFLAFMGGVCYEGADHTHGHWHWASYPSLFVGLFAATRAHSKIKAAKR